MAADYVTGVAAAKASLSNGFTATNLRELIFSSSDKLDNLFKKQYRADE